MSNVLAEFTHLATNILSVIIILILTFVWNLQLRIFGTPFRFILSVAENRIKSLRIKQIFQLWNRLTNIKIEIFQIVYIQKHLALLRILQKHDVFQWAPRSTPKSYGSLNTFRRRSFWFSYVFPKKINKRMTKK